MKQTYRDLLKHSLIYGLGQVVTSLTSVIMLPIYTRYLSPADYGVLAIVQVTVSILGVILGSGVLRAVNRYHFDMEGERSKDRLWWTGLVALSASAALVVVPAYLWRGSLATMTLGRVEHPAGRYYALALGTLFLSILGQLFQDHLRVHKRSGLMVGMGLAQLALAVALNLLYLVRLGRGVEGVLTANLLANGAAAAALFVLFARVRGFGFDPRLIKPLLLYGGPLILTALLATGMHQLDRYLLRVFLDLEQVGLYSVAYAIGRGINNLVLVPFSRIWYVAIYEVARERDAETVYTETFRIFFYGLTLIMLGVSLFSQPVIELLTSEKFFSAAGLVPVVCLAYLLFSLHSHFNVPALLAKRTVSLLPSHAVALVVNVLANISLIPLLGVYGAAWASVLAFAAFSFVGLAIYRRIDRYDYPFVRCASALGGAAASFVAWKIAFPWAERPLMAAAAALAIWSVWAVVLLGPAGRELWRQRRSLFGASGGAIDAARLGAE